MEKKLVNYINAQRKEAEEFSKQPGCWMGSMVEPSDTEYWNDRVPSGTLVEFKRIQLEEDAYYCIADAYSKGYARSMDFASMTDEGLTENEEFYSGQDVESWVWDKGILFCDYGKNLVKKLETIVKFK